MLFSTLICAFRWVLWRRLLSVSASLQNGKSDYFFFFSSLFSFWVHARGPVISFNDFSSLHKLRQKNSIIAFIDAYNFLYLFAAAFGALFSITDVDVFHLHRNEKWRLKLFCTLIDSNVYDNLFHFVLFLSGAFPNFFVTIMQSFVSVCYLHFCYHEFTLINLSFGSLGWQNVVVCACLCSHSRARWTNSFRWRVSQYTHRLFTSWRVTTT